MINNQIVKVYKKPNNTIMMNYYFVYKRKLILCREFRNDDNVEKLTTIGGKLFQTFTTRSLKKFFRTLVRQ